MENNTKRANVCVLTITRGDAVDAGLTLLGNGQTTREISANNRLASGTFNAFLFDALRSGWLRDDIEDFRTQVYERAECDGYVVNRKTNSVLTATSRAATFSDRADRFEFLNVASNFGEAIKLAKNRDETREAQAQAEQAELAAMERAEQAELAAMEQAEQDQRQRDEAALLVEQSIAEDKASGKYAAELLERIRSLVAELTGLGVSVTLTEG